MTQNKAGMNQEWTQTGSGSGPELDKNLIRSLHRTNDKLVWPLAAGDHWGSQSNVFSPGPGPWTPRQDGAEHCPVARDLNTQLGRHQVTGTMKTFKRAGDTILVTITLTRHKLDHAILVTSLKGDLIKV